MWRPRPPEVFVAAEAGRNVSFAPLSFSPDGRQIFGGGLGGIGSISVGSADAPTWIAESRGLGSAALSPDGKWIAYSATESGRSEVFVSPFPNVTDDRVLVSKEGGQNPLWSRDGKELFYVQGPGFPAPLMVATVPSDGGKFTVLARKPVWNANPPPRYFAATGSVIFRNYDLSPDNQRFIVLKDLKPAAAADAPEQIFIVQNWTEELKRRVPWPKK